MSVHGDARAGGREMRSGGGRLTALLVLLFSLGSAVVGRTEEQRFDEVELLRLRIEQLTTDAEARVLGAEIATRRALQSFYERRGFRRAWQSPEASEDLLRAVRGIAADGLDPDDYLLGELERVRAAVAAGEPSLEDRIDHDILQTDALARLLYHLAFGKVTPKSFDPHWNFTRKARGVDAATFLEQVVESGQVYERIEAEKPTHELYLGLRAELARQRALAEAGEPAQVPGGPKLEQGVQGPRVAALRSRLGLTAEGDQFDDAVVERVKQVQASHGLDVDGVVGPATLAAINLSAADRIARIRVNLERMRWYLHDLDPTFVFVNLAGYRVTYLRDGKVVWSAPAIIGKPYRATPVFRSEMTYLVLNPTWTVPPTILAQDMLPAQRRDPAYLDRKGIKVVDRNGRVVPTSSVDWSKARPRSFPYQLVQGPGPANALGRVKFMFPNSYSVYLHDTSAPELFGKSERAFSSGCIRVANPLDFAALLLEGESGWNRAAIDEVVASGKTRTVKLSKPVPVLLTYFTAWVDQAGTLQLRRDVYGRDEKVLRGIEAEFHVQH
ncbi:MAG: L,D-transpeptidase family protein [Myxococcota bacterium]